MKQFRNQKIEKRKENGKRRNGCREPIRPELGNGPRPIPVTNPKGYATRLLFPADRPAPPVSIFFSLWAVPRPRTGSTRAVHRLLLPNPSPLSKEPRPYKAPSSPLLSSPFFPSRDAARPPRSHAEDRHCCGQESSGSDAIGHPRVPSPLLPVPLSLAHSPDTAHRLSPAGLQ
jgi:hypothetical protein